MDASQILDRMLEQSIEVREVTYQAYSAYDVETGEARAEFVDANGKSWFVTVTDELEEPEDVEDEDG